MAEEAKKKVKKEKIPRVSMPEQEPAVRAKRGGKMYPMQKTGLCYRLSGGN
jgi:hypothetical protein